MDKIEGYIEVGYDERGQIVINLPKDMTGHIVFSLKQAQDLAFSILNKISEALHDKGVKFHG